MPRTIFRRRWLVVAGYLLAQGVVMYVGAGLLFQDLPSVDFDYLRDDDYALSMAIAWAVVCVLQGLFLLPVRRPAPTGRRGKALFLSIAIAALCSALLLTGLCVAVLDTVFLYTTYPEGDAAGWLLLTGLAVSWLAATPVLWVFARGKRRETFLAKVSSRLFLGTLVEAVAVIPLDVMVRRKTECYCGAGTFWALLACGGIGTFALGPAILLAVLGGRRRRWYAGWCEVCGYDMSGTPRAERCPECGSGWKPPPADAGVPERR